MRRRDKVVEGRNKEATRVNLGISNSNKVAIHMQDTIR